MALLKTSLFHPFKQSFLSSSLLRKQVYYSAFCPFSCRNIAVKAKNSKKEDNDKTDENFRKEEHIRSTFFSFFPAKVRIVEVSARDGLQNEKQVIEVHDKIRFIKLLSESGLKTIEVASFVNPTAIPQMANSGEVLRQIEKHHDISYPVLVPNIKGYDTAIENGAKEVAVFLSSSETFSKKNTNSTIEESLSRFDKIFDAAKHDGTKVRGYVSCVFGCPFEGSVDSEKVANLTKILIDKGCYEVSLGDTIGIGTPGSTGNLLYQLIHHERIPPEKLAVHFHDTYGQALANILTALQYGIEVIDSSVGGLGGCPYANGATGNVATEDLLYMLNGMGIETGIDLDQLLKCTSFIFNLLGKKPNSKCANAIMVKMEKMNKN